MARDGSAEKAGLQVGDVLTTVGDHPIDQDGNYKDPRYGKISIIHLLSTRYFEGDVVPFKIIRGGKEETLNVTLNTPSPSRSIIEPYTIDKAPRYYIVGGPCFRSFHDNSSEMGTGMGQESAGAVCLLRSFSVRSF